MMNKEEILGASERSEWLSVVLFSTSWGILEDQIQNGLDWNEY